MNTNPSQAQKILTRLREANGAPVEMPELVRISGSYNVHSRISELRGEGHMIFQRTKRVNGVNHSTYWLIEKREVAHV